MSNTSQLGQARLGELRLGDVGFALPPNTIAGASGIPSAEAFDVGTVAGTGLVGSTGIPTGEVVSPDGVLGGANQIIGIPGQLPSQEAFGVGAIGVGIKGYGGIPTEESLGVSGALFNRRGNFILFIDGQDVTDYLQADTLSLQLSSSSRSTANFTLYNFDAGSFRPAVGQDILYYAFGQRRFGGIINVITEQAFIGTNKYQLAIQCVDYAGILDHRIVGKYYDGALTLAVSSMIADIVSSVLSSDGFTFDPSGGDPGVNTGVITLDWVTVKQAFDQLLQYTNWGWSVDFFKVIRIYPSNVGTATCDLTIADNDDHWRTMSVVKSTTNYANRVGVRTGSNLTNLFTDIFHGDNFAPVGQKPQPAPGTQGFITTFNLLAAPLVRLNGVTQIVVGLPLPATPFDWYWVSPGGFGVFQNPTHTPIGPTDTLTVSYPGNLSAIVFVQNDSQIAARAAIEGDSGLYEIVVQDQYVTDAAGAQQFGEGYLARYGNPGPPVEINFETDRPNVILPGMLISIGTTFPLVPSALYLITQVSTAERGKLYLRSQVKAVSGALQSHWFSFYEKLIAKVNLPVPRNTEVATFSLAPDVPGVTNPGIAPSSTLRSASYVVRNKGIIRDFSVMFEVASNIAMRVTVLLNSSSISGTDPAVDYVLYGPYGSNPPVVEYTFNRDFAVTPGDVIWVTVLVDNSSSTSPKRGVITLTIDD